jgi:hypothetical protein
MRKTKDRNLEGYIEKHHIFPQSIFGKNKFTVKLTAREHFIAHLLLWKDYKKRCGPKHKNTIRMALALGGMIYGQNYDRKINSHIFQILRKEAAKALSIRSKGIPKSETHRKNIRLAKLGDKNPLYGITGKDNPNFGLKRTEEIKKKLSAIRRSPNNPLRNKPRTEEDKQKIKNSCRFRMKPIERIDKETGEVKEYESINSAGRDGFSASHIHSCIHNKRVSHKGYYWKYL